MKTKIEEIDYGQVEEKLVRYLSEVAEGRKVLIGLSGGIDSCITCVLSKKALGEENVKALIMTNTRFTRQNLENSRKFATKLGIDYEEVDSTKLREELIKSLNIDEQNIIQSASVDARICDTILKTIAAKENRIYLGTINSTERLTGWYPKGTLVGDFCPLGGLLKEQIKRLAMHMGLEYLVETVSENSKQICSGCGELPEFEGIPYKVMDETLYAYETCPNSQIHSVLNELNISKEIYNIIIDRVKRVSHKSHVFPDYCKINLPNGE